MIKSRILIWRDLSWTIQVGPKFSSRVCSRERERQTKRQREIVCTQRKGNVTKKQTGIRRCWLGNLKVFFFFFSAMSQGTLAVTRSWKTQETDFPLEP